MVRSEATFRGHAIHPAAVTLPLGAAPTAILLDALHVWSGEPAWSLAGFVATLVVAAGIVVASIPGTIDFLRVVPREGEVWRRAKAHMALGWVVGTYYVVFAFARWLALPAPPPWAGWAILAAGVVGYGAMLLQGYWGGELVERHRVGVHEDEDVEREARARSRRGPVGGGPP